MRLVHKKQKGFVSIFIVIFTAILIAVITISFIRLMIKDQQQATTDDLSRSAYDSAQAGVEDAKRALLNYMSVCNGGDTAACQSLKETIDSSKCNAAVSGADLSEVNIQTGEANDLDQAYTCVKIKLNTDNYLGSLLADGSKMIPLNAVSGFDTIKIEWFNANNSATNTINLLAGSITPLLKTWGSSQTNSTITNNSLALAGSDRPPIMRTQVIQLDKINGFSLSDFDNNISSSGSNTLFLYPIRMSAVVAKNIVSLDSRRDPVGAPEVVSCGNLSTTAAYSCTALIKLPSVVTSEDHLVYLNLSAFYNRTDYQITLLKTGSSTPVKFSAVQPEIDSTGRANDLFRRVKTRVELTDVNFAYPEAAVDLTGSFCKDFSITDNPNDYNIDPFDLTINGCND